MKKKFAFLKFHVDEDHKHTGSVDSKEFFSNPVMLKTDRFLEKELREIMKLGNRRPYTLVVNTAGCNRNCWFCYAYPILKKKDYGKCKTIILSPDELAKCFVDKLCSVKNNVKRKDRFFSKLRITGGEPLFSKSDTLIGSVRENYSFETINYFLEFFELLDSYVNKLVRERAIFLSPPKKYSEDIPFPTFFSYDNRIEIRFDTNGFLFGDYQFAKRFVCGVYSLFEASRLNNLLIRIDYSLKGAHPLEVFWSQNQKLPIDESIAKDFTVEEHPQYAGLKNILDLIFKQNQKNSKFGNCLGITVEPGISNVKRNYMYYRGSLNWKTLNKKLKEAFGESFNLSDVDNKMELGRGTKYKTHLKRGVAVKVIFDGKEFICSPTDSQKKKKELDTLLRRLSHENKEAVKIYIPYIKGSERECRQLQLKL